jgi:HupE / UreJ protein
MLLAGAFGLVHGLAFASASLADLGLTGSASVLGLLTFDVGVELAQLMAVARLFPSLYLISRTRFHPAVRLPGRSRHWLRRRGGRSTGWASSALRWPASRTPSSPIPGTWSSVSRSWRPAAGGPTAGPLLALATPAGVAGHG